MVALIDSTSYILVPSDTTPSLPDPATVSQRAHMLVNRVTAATTWSSSGGATPFLVNGVSAATLSVARGATQLAYSNGSQWVTVAPQSAGRRIFAGTAVSNASGDATFTFTPPFATVPVVGVAVQTANTNTTEARITALTASSCTVNVRGSAVLVVLGLNVLGAPAPLAGATVHLEALEAGQGV